MLAPAITYAEEGFPVGEVVSVYLARQREDALRRRADGEDLSPAAAVRRASASSSRIPILRWTYRQIATHGRDAFYKGEIAQEDPRYLQARTAARCSRPISPSSEAEWVDPISTTYRGWTVYELPPNGQGIAALEMLNIMESFPLGGVRATIRCARCTS